MKDTIDRDFLSASISYIDVKSIDPHWWIFTSIFVAFSFLVLEGLTSMLYLSVYTVIAGNDKKDDPGISPEKTI